MKKDDKRTLIVILVICSILSIIFFILNYKSKYEKLEYVTDYQEFFSISADIGDFIGYVASGNSDSIIGVLDNKYVVDNNINSGNIINYFDDFTINDSFKAKSIKYVDFGKNKLYYVTGSIIANDINDSRVINDNYEVIVLVDNSSRSYAIHPISDVKKDINNIKKINISSNNYNNINIISDFDDVALCRLYYSDFYSYIINDLEKAYSLLNDNMLKKYPNYNDFKNLIQSNSINMTSITKLCSVSDLKKGKLISVIDNNDNSYTFTVKNIMNYDVNIALKETSE